MFEKLKRARSFVVRTKTKEELDLSESSHLRRTAVIDKAALARQKQLTNAQRPKTRLNRQISASHEKIYDDRAVLEQIRRINFGDAKSSAKKEVVECYNKSNNLGSIEEGRTGRTKEQRPWIRDVRASRTSEHRFGDQEGLVRRTSERPPWNQDVRGVVTSERRFGDQEGREKKTSELRMWNQDVRGVVTSEQRLRVDRIVRK